jgi:transcriptional regulator
VYVPAKFRVGDDDAWRVVRDAGAGVLLRATPSGLASVFVPVVVSDDLRTISSHVARANPWCRAIEPGEEILAVFLAASAYVSPSFYPSRLTNPKVVPTWNYVAAEVRGRVHVHEEHEWKLAQVRRQTERFEQGRSPEWRVDDAPAQYIDQQLKAIVGLEIDVISVEGKAKLSQNRPVEDSTSVREHLESGSLTERNVAQRMDSDE